MISISARWKGWCKLAIKIERCHENGTSYDPQQIITLSPVARIEARITRDPYLADRIADSREETDPNAPYLQYQWKIRQKFNIHERVVAAGGKTAEECAHDRLKFLQFKDFKDKIKFTWNDYQYWGAITSARIVKAPAEDIFDCYIEIVEVRL